MKKRKGRKLTNKIKCANVYKNTCFKLRIVNTVGHLHYLRTEALELDVADNFVV